VTKNKGFNITALTGNHEMMLVDSYNDLGNLPLWYMNSGMTTLISFDIPDIKMMEPEYVNFFSVLEYFKTINDLIFVHAGFNDYAPDPFSDYNGMIWECRMQYTNPVLEGKTIIHGHRPKTIEYVKSIIERKERIIPIDTGCVYEKEQGYGNLSALEVNTMNLISVSNY